MIEHCTPAKLGSAEAIEHGWAHHPPQIGGPGFGAGAGVSAQSQFPFHKSNRVSLHSSQWEKMLHPLLVGIIIFSFETMRPRAVAAASFSALEGTIGEERR